MSTIKKPEDQKLKRFGTFIQQTIDIDNIPLLKSPETRKFFNPVSYEEKNITFGLYEYSREFLTNYVNITKESKKEIRAVVLPDYKQEKYVMNGWYNNSMGDSNYSMNDFLKKLFLMTARDEYNPDSYNVGQHNGVTYYIFSSYNNVIKIGLILLKDILNKKSKDNILNTSFESFVDAVIDYKYTSFVDKLSILLNFIDGPTYRKIVESCEMFEVGFNFEKEYMEVFDTFIHQKEKHFFDVALDDQKVFNALLMNALYTIWLYIPKDSDMPKDMKDMMGRPQKSKKGKGEEQDNEEEGNAPGEGGGKGEKGEGESFGSAKNEADPRTREEILNDSIDFFRNQIHNDAIDSYSFEEYIKDNNKSFGNESGFQELETANVPYKKFDKNDTLGKYANISDSVTVKYKFNKRKVYKVYESKILPYGWRIKQKECAIILLDVSGSCHHLIPKFLELVYSPKVISEIYFFDTQLLVPEGNRLIKTKEDLFKFVKNIPMGGGTDLNVPLQELKILYKNRFPKNIFIFTDGYMSEVDLKGISANIVTYSIDQFMEFNNSNGCKFVNIKIKQSDII